MSDEIVDVAPKEQPARVALSVELVNDVLTYLAARPYREVAGLIQAIHAQAAAQPKG